MRARAFVCVCVSVCVVSAVVKCPVPLTCAVDGRSRNPLSYYDDDDDDDYYHHHHTLLQLMNEVLGQQTATIQCLNTPVLPSCKNVGELCRYSKRMESK